MVEIDYVGEGLTDAAVARRLIVAAGALPGRDYVTTRPPRGKNALDKRLRGFVAGARFRKILILRDLDDDATCAGELIRRLAPNAGLGYSFRIAVRAAEAWLMADADAFAAAIGVHPRHIPENLEALSRPKDIVIDLARKSRLRHIRQALPPGEGAGIRVGPGLGIWLSEFASESWDPGRAIQSQRSPSLARALQRITELILQGAAAG